MWLSVQRISALNHGEEFVWFNYRRRNKNAMNLKYSLLYSTPLTSWEEQSSVVSPKQVSKPSRLAQE